MPNDPRAGRAVCPFYQKSKDNYISCECAIGGTRILHMFADREEAETHLTNYCNTLAYTRCPYAIMLVGLYRD